MNWPKIKILAFIKHYTDVFKKHIYTENDWKAIYSVIIWANYKNNPSVSKYYIFIVFNEAISFTCLIFQAPPELHNWDLGLWCCEGADRKAQGEGTEFFILLVFWVRFLSPHFWPGSVKLNTIINIFKYTSFFKRFFKCF